jgi:nicotinate-nucleotide adenylyltransferase
MRLGLFGGSFDPVHHGHLLLARSCAQQGCLDEVWFVPAARQPLKPGGPQADPAHRLAMLYAATSHQPNWQVSTIELDRGGTSYTVDTLETVRRERPDDECFFLMGADSLAELPLWHRPSEVLQFARPLVVHRAGGPAADFSPIRDLVSPERYAAISTCTVEMPATPISSSEIRRLIAEGDPRWRTMAPAEVCEYIDKNRLYVEVE